MALLAHLPYKSCNTSGLNAFPRNSHEDWQTKRYCFFPIYKFYGYYPWERPLLALLWPGQRFGRGLKGPAAYDLFYRIKLCLILWIKNYKTKFTVKCWKLNLIQVYLSSRGDVDPTINPKIIFFILNFVWLWYSIYLLVIAKLLVSFWDGATQ